MKAAKIDGSLQIRGEVFARGDLTVEGEFAGNIRSNGFIHVTEEAICRANARSQSAHIEGRWIGDIVCSERIWVGPKARIVGNLRAPKITVHLHAVIEGQVDQRLDPFGVPPKKKHRTLSPLRRALKKQKASRRPPHPPLPVPSDLS